MNDEPFDSTYLRNKSFQFKLGARMKYLFFLFLNIKLF